MQSLGKTIKLHRTWKDISSNELAQTAGISSSYLSKIENDKTNPSINVVAAIANALDINIDELLHTGNQSPSSSGEGTRKRNLLPAIVRSTERKTMTPAGSSVSYELLTPDLQRNLQFIMVCHKPGEKVKYYSHIGEESILCIEGSAQVTVGEEVFVLNPGDCISYDSSISHSVTTVGDEPCVIVSAQTPPSF